MLFNSASLVNTNSRNAIVCSDRLYSDEHGLSEMKQPEMSSMRDVLIESSVTCFEWPFDAAQRYKAVSTSTRKLQCWLLIQPGTLSRHLCPREI